MLELVAVAWCRYNPIKTIKTSFVGTMNMLGLAKRTHAKFLLTSTSEVGDTGSKVTLVAVFLTTE